MFKSIFAVLIILLLLPATTIFAQDEMSADQKAWMDYMTPGPMHEMMAGSVGEWKSKNTFWMDPAGEPMVSEGTVKFEMIMDGRYMKSTHKGTVMGMPFTGMFLQAYDNATKEFIAIWIDNLGTGMSVSKGTYDEGTKTLNSTGTMVDPMSGKELGYRQTVQLIDDNHQVMEMFLYSDGKEYTSMIVELTR
ncbi:MAG: DUF1579 domain-containing protein [Ignavibacteriaceae bacterium]